MKESTKTLMMSKVPEGVTNEDLKKLFEDPTRCFILKSSFKKTSRVGYVEFSTPERAREVLEKEWRIGSGEVIKLKPAKDKDTSKKEKEDVEQRIFDKKVAKEKKSRLILRNLSFKASLEDVEKEFGQYGTIKDVKILTKPDGKRVGCAFLQFSNVQESYKAIKAANGSMFMGRPIALDWAVSKKEYQTHDNDNKTSNSSNSEEVKVNEENVTGNDDDSFENSSRDGEMEVDKSESDDDDDESEQGDSLDEGSRLDDDEESTEKPKSWPKAGHDVNEGKTVFIRNLSFDSIEEDLAALMAERYGEILFAKFVMDKVRDHPKGTAFVKFCEAKSAENAVNDKESLDLDSRTLNVSLALEKSEADSLEEKKKNEKKTSKDKRNLHLAREGLIREGTRAAVGVSKKDLLIRARIQKWKTNILKDLSSFVSSTRLCIRNLPEDYDDVKLRNLFRKYGDLKESKVIRKFKTDPKNAPAEIGFVSFKTHEDALKALRELNNNPEIFSKDCRPVVEFSIENIKAVKAREKRLEKSREKNPNYQKTNYDKGKKVNNEKSKKTLKPSNLSSEDNLDFVGSKNNPKQKGLPSHIGPKVRSKISRRDLKKGEKRKKIREKKLRVIKESGNKSNDIPVQKSSDSKKQTKKKLKPANLKDLKEEKHFNSLVQSYKSKLLQSNEPPAKKRKWFNE